MRRRLLVALAGLLAPPALAQDRVELTGEVIDTWCYFSGVMGGPDAVVGSAHHTCALWCSAGGIPVGLLAEDGTVYMILALGESRESAGSDALFELASHRITVAGDVFARDGLNYLVVDEVLADDGIVHLSHDGYAVVPPFAIPEPEDG